MPCAAQRSMRIVAESLVAVVAVGTVRARAGRLAAALAEQRCEGCARGARHGFAVLEFQDLFNLIRIPVVIVSGRSVFGRPQGASSASAPGFCRTKPRRASES